MVVYLVWHCNDWWGIFEIVEICATEELAEKIVSRCKEESWRAEDEFYYERRTVVDETNIKYYI